MPTYLVIADGWECELPQAHHGTFNSASDALERVRRFRRQGLRSIAIYRDSQPIEELNLSQMAEAEKARARSQSRD